MKALLVGMVGALACVGFAAGGWTATSLHPVGADMSEAYSVRNGKVVGRWHQGPGDDQLAVVWEGPSSMRLLNPPGVNRAQVNSSFGNKMVGHIQDASDRARATLWNESGGTTDLTPAGVDGGYLMATQGLRHGGHVLRQGETHASLWNGDTAADYVDLSPDGALSSSVHGLRGNQQVGSATFDFYHLAGMWTGTSGSFTNLNPAWSDFSRALDTDGDRQVGWAVAPDGFHRAIRWDDTAESAIDLSPPGSVDSWLVATDGNHHAGYYWPANDVGAAALWIGDSNVPINLHRFLPSGFGTSRATDVEVLPNGEIFVVGIAQDDVNFRSRAILWHYSPVPEPATLFTLALGAAWMRRRAQKSP